MSTHDVTGKGRFVLLTGTNGGAWVEAARETADRLGIVLRAVVIGPGGDYTDLYDDWARFREVDEDGCVLVRPDAHVAWRSRTLPADPGGDLMRVVRQVLAR